MLDAIDAEFNTSVTGSYFIGDSLRDLQAALQKGCKPALVKTGNGVRTQAQLAVPGLQTDAPLVTHEQIQVFDNLAAAADFIIASSK